MKKEVACQRTRPLWMGAVGFSVMLFLCAFMTPEAFAHGVAEDDKAFIAQSSGMQDRKSVV